MVGRWGGDGPQVAFMGGQYGPSLSQTDDHQTAQHYSLFYLQTVRIL
jgi:hypothetical protein